MRGPSLLILIVVAASIVRAGDADTPTPTGPAVLYASLPIGGIRGIAADPAGNVYVTGSTPSGRGICGQLHMFGMVIQSYPCPDAFVAKLDPTGSQMLYKTTLGGLNADEGVSIAVDDTGAAYVLGSTYSPDFPVTAGAAQRQYAGPANAVGGFPPVTEGGDLFVAKLDRFGRVIFATFLGGAGNEYARRIRIDSDGNSYVAGRSESRSLPSAPSAPPFVGATGIIAKVNPAGTQVTWTTYLPRYYEIRGFDFDAAGALYVTGLSATAEGPITKLSADSQSAIYDSAFGNPGDLLYDLAVGPNGSAWVVGSGRFGSSFIRKLKPDGSGLDFEQAQSMAGAFAVATDAVGRAYVGGESKHVAVTPNALQPAPGAETPGFLSVVQPDGTVVYASYAPARIVALTLDAIGHVYVTDGRTVTRMNLNLPALTSVVNAASRQPSANVAPGELVTLTGIGLGPQLGVSVQPDAAGTVPTVLAGTRVFFDDTPAPVLFVSAQHVDAVVPFGLQPGTAVKISVQAAGQRSSPLPVGVVSAEPAIFSLFGEGLGQAAARNEDGGLNLPGNPVRLGSIVTLFATGAGLFDPPLADGHVPPVPPPLLRQPLQVLFDEIPSEILFAGAAPGLIGVTQINVRVPLELAGSPNSQHIKIRVIVESISSAPATTIAIH